MLINIESLLFLLFIRHSASGTSGMSLGLNIAPTVPLPMCREVQGLVCVWGARSLEVWGGPTPPGLILAGGLRDTHPLFLWNLFWYRLLFSFCLLLRSFSLLFAFSKKMCAVLNASFLVYLLFVLQRPATDSSVSFTRRALFQYFTFSKTLKNTMRNTIFAIEINQKL